MNCSLNWSVRRSWEGAGGFAEAFQAPPVTHVVGQSSQSTQRNAFTLEMTIHDKCPDAVSQSPKAGTRKQKEKPCEVVCGLTSFCNTGTILLQNNRLLYMQMVLREKLPWCWSRRYGPAVKTPTADVSLFTWTLFIVQQLLCAAALFMDSPCPSTSTAHRLHAKRHFLLVCACAIMSCKRRNYNGIRWRWTSEVSPAGLLTNNTGVTYWGCVPFYYYRWLHLFSHIRNNQPHSYDWWNLWALVKKGSCARKASVKIEKKNPYHHSTKKTWLILSCNSDTVSE